MTLCQLCERWGAGRASMVARIVASCASQKWSSPLRVEQTRKRPAGWNAMARTSWECLSTSATARSPAYVLHKRTVLSQDADATVVLPAENENQSCLQRHIQGRVDLFSFATSSLGCGLPTLDATKVADRTNRKPRPLFRSVCHTVEGKVPAVDTHTFCGALCPKRTSLVLWTLGRSQTCP
jgi:hypothetical protein